MNEMMPVLEVRNISKSFSGVMALRELNLQVFPGQVTAITGENGAGKSTLMKIISGVYTDYQGQVLLNNKEVRFTGPKEAAGQGVIMIHQELNLIPQLSVAENIFLGREPVHRSGILDYGKMNQEAGKILSLLQLSIDPSTPVDRLRVGQQQLVEIARALLYDSKVLIMDEPTSAISEHEVELLFRIIRNLTAKGVAIIYISHKLKEIFEIADRYAVLRDGGLIGIGEMKNVTRDRLIQMMVGRQLMEYLKNDQRKFGDELLRVENLCLKDPENRDAFRVENVNFTLHRGEVLGICGLMGSGRTEVLESVFGLFPEHVTGKIFIKGEEHVVKSVRDAIRAGIALVPEDRKLQGLVLNMTVAMNISLASLGRISRFGFISKHKEEMLRQEYADKMNIRIPAAEMEVEKLSGGNQQKVVISKWLATNPEVLLLDEPTRGIDVGAKAEIYDLIRKLTEQGMGIIVVSSELPEVLAVSDNILVMSESKPTAKLPRAGTTEEMIMKAALIQKHN
jgi:ribose transport system ATP-binding protein